MQGYIDKIASLAEEALKEELDTTPKPGLVDKDGSGAHADMDYALFNTSIKAITPYIREFAVVSLGSKDTQTLALSLKEIGQRAENAMFIATNGVNTHKGAIFALGILIGALVSKSIDKETNLKILSHQIKNFAEELKPMRAKGTHGSIACQKYNVEGAFGQALNGYEKLFSLTLPMFNKYAKEGYSPNDINILILLNLMATLDDTNVLYRVGMDEYVAARAKVLALLDNYNRTALQYLCENFDKNNISFGGCADMLMLSIFAHKLIENGFLTFD